MRRATIIVVFALCAAPAFAAEPEGCDKFKWPVERDRIALLASDRAPLASGAGLAANSGKAVLLRLAPTASAGLPTPPERAPAADRFAGYVKVAAPAAGSYTISLASAVWIDVVQGGRFLKPAAFSGATGCDGIRKTVRFDLAAEPFVIQLSSSTTDAAGLLLRSTD